jgi:hypothetical protein
MFRAADHDDARTMLRSARCSDSPAATRAHGCGSVPESDRLPLAALGAYLTGLSRPALTVTPAATQVGPGLRGACC